MRLTLTWPWSSSYAVYSLKMHIVFVTKYRRKTLAPELLNYLHGAFGEILLDWRCRLLEFGGEADHVHLLVEIHPALNISTPGASATALPSISSRSIRNRISGTGLTMWGVWAAQHSKRSDAMWNLRERLKKQEEEKQNRPLDPLLPCGLRRGMREQMFNMEMGWTMIVEKHLDKHSVKRADRRQIKTSSSVYRVYG
ncbi:MAG: IS200/IS605 family transposase [Leptospirillum sp.]